MVHAEKIILFIACMTAVTCATATAFACKTRISCDIERIEGEVPCVELTTQDESCDVIATWTCKQDDPPVTITRLNNRRGVTLGGGGATAEGVGAGSYTWQRGEQSGTLEIIGTSRTSGDCSQLDQTCTTAPASRHANIPHLIILTISLIAGWRRYNNPPRDRQI